MDFSYPPIHVLPIQETSLQGLNEHSVIPAIAHTVETFLWIWRETTNAMQSCITRGILALWEILPKDRIT